MSHLEESNPFQNQFLFEWYTIQKFDMEVGTNQKKHKTSRKIIFPHLIFGVPCYIQGVQTTGQMLDPGRPRRFCTAPWPHPKNVVKGPRSGWQFRRRWCMIVYVCTSTLFLPPKRGVITQCDFDTFLFRDWVA